MNTLIAGTIGIIIGVILLSIFYLGCYLVKKITRRSK
jgi:hypothetical protein